MKSKNALCGLSVAVILLLGILTASAQTNQYLYTGSETNITLPPGTYNITAYGGQGGYSGGLGAEMEGQFNFAGVTTLTILVGGGSDGDGGGGGSFVVNGNTPLVIAGGGGGNGSHGGGGNGVTNTNGGAGVGQGGSGGIGGGGGVAGNGPSCCNGGGGGGYYAGGSNSVYSDASGGGGGSFISGGGGGSGGNANVSDGGPGGFGGGGGSGLLGGGGGGGYSGGGGGWNNNDGGGGGGSIIDSSAITDLAEVSGVASPDDSPYGEIIITTVPTLTNIVISPTNPVMAAGANETFAATGYFSDGSVSGLTSTNGLFWSSSNPGIAFINNKGIARCLTSGTTIITATEGSVSNNTTLTVQLPLTGQTNIFLFTGSETNIFLTPGIYTITAYGAQGGSAEGGNGGLGAETEAQFNLTGITTLTLLAGGSGGTGEYSFGGGGGGGSFVVNGSTPLVIAGGGGGGAYVSGGAGNVGTAGGEGNPGQAGGTGGAGGGSDSSDPNGGGGGGYSGSGSSSPDDGGTGGGSYLSGGTGGTGADGGGYGGNGGYGGGGGGFDSGGGGGGYSGGGGGGYNTGGGFAVGSGGGGGSIIDSSAITTLTEVSGVASPDDSTGNGEIIITVVPAPPAVSIARVSSLPVVVWPASALDYVLQMSNNLTSGNWVTVTSGIPFSGLQITNAPRAGFFVITAPISTTLGITTATNLPVVTWPAAATDYVLEMTTNLITGPWVTVSNGIPFSGLQITNAPGTTFFRLQ